MGQKMTCPGCDSHTSTVLAAVQEDQPCPYCGLSAQAIVEVNGLRERRDDDALSAQLSEALLRADRAERRALDAEDSLAQVRRIVG
jgi:hypothetical protein